LRYNIAMPIHRLNHAVLYVRDAEVTASFYEGVLGFERLAMGFPGARPTITTWAFFRSGRVPSPRPPGEEVLGSITLPGK
jgi:catechol 2,3-dioxygenase-like lactoylglutathione lyase family enzyme